MNSSEQVRKPGAAQPPGGSSGEVRRRLDLYSWVVAAIGWPVILYSLYQLRGDLNATLAALAVLAAAASILGVRLPLPGKGGGLLTVTVSDCFTFLACLLFGPYAGVALATVDGLAGNASFVLSRFARFMFNVGQIGLSALAACHVFWYLQGAASPFQLDLSTLLPTALKAAVAAVIYFILNAAFISTAIGISSGHSFGVLLKRLAGKFGPAFCLNILAALVAFYPLSPGAETGRLFLGVMIFIALICLLVSRTLSAKVDSVGL